MSTNNSRRLMRRMVAVRLAAVAATSTGLTGAAATLSAGAPAGAAETHQNCVEVSSEGAILSVVPSCSQTINTQGGDPQVQLDSPDPCNQADGTFTMFPRNSVFHINTNKDGDVWVTGTNNGTATFVPTDPSYPSGAGQWTEWFGLNINNRNNNRTSTFDVVMHMSDGGLVTQHEVSHFGLSASGITVTFDHMGGTCH